MGAVRSALSECGQWGTARQSVCRRLGRPKVSVAFAGTGSNRITLQAYGTEKVRIDGSRLPAGSWLTGVYGSYWTS